MKKKRYFQWIEGEQIGEIETLESIEKFEDETIFNFDSGESCNLRFISKMTDNVVDLKKKFMVEIDSPSNAWTIDTVKPKIYTDESMKGEVAEIPSLHDMLQCNGQSSEINSNIGTTKLVKPRNPQSMRELPTINEYGVKPVVKPKTLENVSATIIDNTATPKDEPVNVQEDQKAKVYAASEQKFSDFAIDPVRILVDKCKKHDTPVELEITMKLPAKSVADIARNEFDDGFDKFIDCVVADIDLSKVIDALRDSLRSAYSDENESQ